MQEIKIVVKYFPVFSLSPQHFLSFSNDKNQGSRFSYVSFLLTHLH